MNQFGQSLRGMFELVNPTETCDCLAACTPDQSACCTVLKMPYLKSLDFSCLLNGVSCLTLDERLPPDLFLFQFEWRLHPLPNKIYTGLYVN